jgi:anti-sigma B factor antagonist
MEFHIQEREVDGIVILDLIGRLVLGRPTTEFNEKIAALIDGGKTLLVVNLEKTPMVDSSGLGSLIAAQTSATNAGGIVKLLHVSDRHVQLLVLTRLSTEFQMFNNETAAIDSFFPDRQRAAFDILEFVQKQEDQEQEHIGSEEAPPPPKPES